MTSRDAISAPTKSLTAGSVPSQEPSQACAHSPLQHPTPPQTSRQSRLGLLGGSGQLGSEEFLVSLESGPVCFFSESKRRCRGQGPEKVQQAR